MIWLNWFAFFQTYDCLFAPIMTYEELVIILYKNMNSVTPLMY